MDFYGADRKLSEMSDRDFTDFLDSDMFNSDSHAMDNLGLDSMQSMDNEWLDTFLGDPVLNDRMISETVQPQRVQSEHSYSLTENGEMEPLNLKMETSMDKDLEPDFLVNPDMTMATSPSEMTIKQEPVESIACMTSTSSSTGLRPTPISLNRSTQPQQTLLKQPTIILASQQHQQQSLVASSVNSCMLQIKNEPVSMVPRVNIKVEPAGCPSPYHMTLSHSSLPSPDTASNASSPEHNVYDRIGMPPTPPSSGSSDSEGGLSPQRSCPASPMRGHTPLARQQAQLRTISQPLFTSPIPTSGVLILTEEEKRTLISEGYPIPAKLPLTKQEEKNLKKIRRKIKNKISAQESRRKKKEYMETLEKRMEAFSQENNDLKKKVDHLENNNRSLLSQLHKLQSLVSKVPRPSSPAATQTGTCLMVLVLFFAVFLGTWSPSSLSIGYTSLFSSSSVSSAASSSSSSSPVSSMLNMAPAMTPAQPPMGPDVQDNHIVDPYATPSMKSRVLMSIKDDVGGDASVEPAYSYHDLLLRFISFCSSSEDGAPQPHPVEVITKEESTLVLQQHQVVASYDSSVTTTVAANAHNTTA